MEKISYLCRCIVAAANVVVTKAAVEREQSDACIDSA